MRPVCFGSPDDNPPFHPNAAGRSHRPRHLRPGNPVSNALPRRSLRPALSITTGIDPHNYNSGRWVRDNKLQHELRFIQFDFDLLCEKVLALSGASFITHCEKTESGLNRVFTFALDNGQRVEARLPFKFAGPERLGTASEVATIQYREHHPARAEHRGSNRPLT